MNCFYCPICNERMSFMYPSQFEKIHYYNCRIHGKFDVWILDKKWIKREKVKENFSRNKVKYKDIIKNKTLNKFNEEKYDGNDNY